MTVGEIIGLIVVGGLVGYGIAVWSDVMVTRSIMRAEAERPIGRVGSP